MFCRTFLKIPHGDGVVWFHAFEKRKEEKRKRQREKRENRESRATSREISTLKPCQAYPFGITLFSPWPSWYMRPKLHRLRLLFWAADREYHRMLST